MLYHEEHELRPIRRKFLYPKHLRVPDSIFLQARRTFFRFSRISPLDCVIFWGSLWSCVCQHSMYCMWFSQNIRDSSDSLINSETFNILPLSLFLPWSILTILRNRRQQLTHTVTGYFDVPLSHPQTLLIYLRDYFAVTECSIILVSDKNLSKSVSKYFSFNGSFNFISI